MPADALSLILEIQKLSQMLMHAVEQLEEVGICKTAVLLCSFLADLNEFLLAQDLYLLGHHGLTAPQFFVELRDGPFLMLGKNFEYAQPYRMGYGFEYFRGDASFLSSHGFSIYI
jgi:hypothetical protein